MIHHVRTPALRSARAPPKAVWAGRLAISAVSVPPMANSRSAYFFQYPKKSGYLARKQLKVLRTSSMVDGLEFRVTPPSSSVARVTSASHRSNSSSFSTCTKVSARARDTRAGGSRSTHHGVKQLLDLSGCFVARVGHLRNAATPVEEHGDLCDVSDDGRKRQSSSEDGCAVEAVNRGGVYLTGLGSSKDKSRANGSRVDT